MNQGKSKIEDDFVNYCLVQHRNDVLRILKEPEEERHYSVFVNFVTLFENNPLLGDGVLSDPITVIPICDTALVLAQNAIKREMSDYSLTIKPQVHVRITALPVCPELYKSVFPGNEDVGSFLRITGTVVRRTMPKMLEYKKVYICSKCKHQFTTWAEYEKMYVLQEASVCKNYTEGCKSTNLKCVSSHECYKDYQELKLQEQVGKLDMNSIPKSMCVTVEDDLVDACKPGDDVIICGTVRRRWKPLRNNGKIEVDVVLQANYLEVCNHRKNSNLTKEVKDEFVSFWERNRNSPLQARNLILQSISPEVYGLYVIKLAIALALAGGVPQDPGSGARIRGESHLLLVGDPGTAKSQLLRFASSVSSRTVFTTGIGSTSAGLTVSAVMGSGGEWQLEAGALVLADGGLCCIDEFNSIRESERASIHEAMEQQTISIAKAGIVCKLNTRCTILAATNPKGQYDPLHPITVNCAIASPLLSRFDLVFVLLDNKNREWDQMISTYVLEGKTLNRNYADNLWSLEKLQAYYCIIKDLTPQLSEEAIVILQEYYKLQRKKDVNNASRTTVRLLESLIRLSQAHARIMFRNEVTVQDAVVSVSLMEASSQGSLNLSGFNVLRTTFPEDALQEYIEQATQILNNLGLPLILENELQHVNESRGTSTQVYRIEEQTGSVEESSFNEKLHVVLNNIRQAKLKKEQDANNYRIEKKKPVKKTTLFVLSSSESDSDEPKLKKSKTGKKKSSTNGEHSNGHFIEQNSVNDSQTKDTSTLETSKEKKKIQVNEATMNKLKKFAHKSEEETRKNSLDQSVQFSQLMNSSIFSIPESNSDIEFD